MSDELRKSLSWIKLHVYAEFAIAAFSLIFALLFWTQWRQMPVLQVVVPESFVYWQLGFAFVFFIWISFPFLQMRKVVKLV